MYSYICMYTYVHVCIWAHLNVWVYMWVGVPCAYDYRAYKRILCIQYVVHFQSKVAKSKSWSALCKEQ